MDLVVSCALALYLTRITRMTKMRKEIVAFSLQWPVLSHGLGGPMDPPKAPIGRLETG